MRALARALGVRGTVHYVDSAKFAVEYLEGSGPYANRERHPFPAMLITDLNMMHGDGFAVLELLRLNPGWSVVPKIVFTSSDDPGDIATAYLLGASTYHQKPCAASELAACSSRMLSYWLTCLVPQTDRTGRLLSTEHQGKLGERYPLPAWAAKMQTRLRSFGENASHLRAPPSRT